MAEPIRVLHVDDEPDIGELAAEFIEREDDRFSVVTESSARDGLDRLAAEDGTIDCIVSDYQMPGMDGLAFLDAVRDDYSDLPFILFTGKGSEDLASDALARGLTDYLQKGTGSDQYAVLANRIETAVEQYRSKRRLWEREQELARRTRRLKETRDRLKLALKATNTYTFDWDLQANEIRRHPTVQDMFGLPSMEAKQVFENFFDYVHPDHRDRVRREINDAIDAARSYECEYPIGTADGEWTWVRERADVLTENAESRRVVGMVTDITVEKEREKRLQRERDRFSALFENIAVPIAYYEFENDVPIAKDVNPAFEETFDVTAAAARGHALDDLLVPDEYTNEGREINERVRKGEIIDTEVVRQANDGKRTFNLLSVPFHPEESGTRGFAVYSEIRTGDHTD